MMQEPVIVRTNDFNSALEALFADDYQGALGLFTRIRATIEADQQSVVEVERWIARCFECLGKKEEALVILLAHEAWRTANGDEMSCHYNSVVCLLSQMGRTNELVEYCQKIAAAEPANSLSHLDWILIYATCAAAPAATPFVRRTLRICASQLGLDPLEADQWESEWVLMVQKLIAFRNQANHRFAAFWKVHNGAKSSELANSVLEAFTESEPSPYFRDLACTKTATRGLGRHGGKGDATR